MYRFLNHTADVMFEVEARGLDELFSDAAKALFETMAELKKVKPRIKRIIKIKNNDVSELLFDFLSKLILIKDADAMLFSKFDTKIEKDGLNAVVYGEKIAMERHNLGVDVKAVTKHDFIVERKNNKWYARILLDV